MANAVQLLTMKDGPLKSLAAMVPYFVALLLTGCTGLPQLTLLGDRAAAAQSGPKVASLVAHLKCETAEAVNSNEELPFYDNVPALTKSRQLVHPPDRRAFTLNNLFKEVEFIGEATWTLDVTQTGAFNPSISLSKYFTGPVGTLPATGALLSVGGQLSEAAHRYVTFNSSIDVSRLNATERAPFGAISSPVTPIPPEKKPPCSDGSELTGDLGLKEALVDGLIAAGMNDISALQSLEGTVSGGLAGGITAGPLTVPASNNFGQISTQVDFTIIESANAGPTWNLKYFKGPGGGSSGLFNYTRQVHDTLIVTFVPVCIRQKYWTNDTAAPYSYHPQPIEGTPPWANILPPCGGIGYGQARLNAASSALGQNQLILIQNSIPR